MTDTTTRTYHVQIEEEPDGSYWGHVEELPGCFVAGATVDELLQTLRPTIELYLGDGRDQNDAESSTHESERPHVRSLTVAFA